MKLCPTEPAPATDGTVPSEASFRIHILGRRFQTRGTVNVVLAPPHVKPVFVTRVTVKVMFLAATSADGLLLNLDTPEVVLVTVWGEVGNPVAATPVE